MFSRHQLEKPPLPTHPTENGGVSGGRSFKASPPWAAPKAPEAKRQPSNRGKPFGAPAPLNGNTPPKKKSRPYEGVSKK